jgi:hypothetical protein
MSEKGEQTNKIDAMNESESDNTSTRSDEQNPQVVDTNIMQPKTNAGNPQFSSTPIVPRNLVEPTPEDRYIELENQLKFLSKEVDQFLRAYRKDLNTLEKDEMNELKANMIGRKLLGRDKQWQTNITPKLNNLEREMQRHQINQHMEEVGRQMFEMKEAFLEEKVNGRALLQIKFPKIFQQIFPTQNTGSSMTDTQRIVIEQKKHSALYLDAKKSIPENFQGDENSPSCLQDYSSWKAAWEIFYNELKNTTDGSPIIAFSKMKTVLSGEALRLVSNLDARDPMSYDKAIKTLEDKYSDKIALAISFIKDTSKSEDDPVKKIREMDHALAGLLALKEAFAKETVSFYDFTLILIMSANMTEDMLDHWTSYKETLKQQHLANQRNKSAGETEKPWTAGMAENVETFRAWMSVFVAPLNKKENKIQPQTPETSASNFFVKREDCFVCDANHPYWKCPKVMRMSRKNWRNTCYNKKRCMICANNFADPNHVPNCTDKCRLCSGSHNSVICPNNRYRTAELGEKRVAEEVQKETKKARFEKNENEKNSQDLNNIKKIEDTIKRILNEMNKPSIPYQPKLRGRWGRGGRGAHGSCGRGKISK